MKYLLVGGFALAFHGYVRATRDLGLWIKDENENIEKLKRVLSTNGVKGIEESHELQLVAEFTQFHVGTSGFVVDPMTDLKRSVLLTLINAMSERSQGSLGIFLSRWCT